MATKNSTSYWIDEHKNYLLPSIFGGVVAWAFSQNIIEAFVVFLAVWAGNWFVASLKSKR